MPIRKTLLASMFVGAFGLTMTAAIAQPGPGPGPGPGGPQGHGGPGFHHGLLEGVTLTDDQKSKLHALMQSNRPDHALFDQLRQVHEQIDAAMYSTGTVTEQSLQPLLQKEAALMQQMQQNRLSQEIAVRNLLTPEQLAAASSTHAKLKALHQQEHDLMRHGDNGPSDQRPG